MPIKHALTSVTPDDPAYEIKPSDWNADHTLPTAAEVGAASTTHASTHSSAGSDAVDVKNLGGFPGGTGTFLRGDATFATPPDIGITQLTSDVTAGPGSGSQAATIADNAVTFAKMQNISAASKIVGRGSAAGAGDPEEITLGTNLSMSGTTLNATDTGITQLTSDVTAGPGSGSQAATIADNAVTYAKMQDVTAASKLLGRGSAAGAGDPQEITLGTNLSMSGTTLNAAGGAGASWTTVEANLTLGWRGKFTITDAAISPTSKVIIQQAPGPYTGKGTRADEAEMDPLWCVAAPGTGQATVHWRTMTMQITTFRGIVGAQPLSGTQAQVPSFSTALQNKLVGRVRGNVKFQYTVAS